MSTIEIKTVTTNADLNTFIKFPWEVYEEYPHWVPPLLYEQKGLLNKKKNPFFKHAEADYFLAYKDGKLSGRIAAIKNDLHNETHSDKVGFFGFFECFDDQEVANALLDKAYNWLKEKGLESMRGPANFSSNDVYGMLVEPFDVSPMLMMPYNPPYYLTLLENYGMEKAKDLLAYKITYNEMGKAEKLFRVGELAKKRAKFHVRPVNMKDFKNELNRFKDIYNAAWEPNWGFVPLTDDEINHMAADLKPLVEPSIVLFGEIDGEVVAAVLCMLDYNYIFKQMNGRLLPFNFLKLFTQKKKIRKLRIITLGIKPEFQKRGLDAVLYKEVWERGAVMDIKEGEAGWVLEDNIMMNKGAEMMNAEASKRYRLYEKPVI